MKSVSNLNRVWGAQSHAISDAETTITRYDLRTGMLSQPTRQGRRFIVGQHFDRAAYCQVHQEQSIVGAARSRPLPTQEAPHSWRTPGRATDGAGYMDWLAAPQLARFGLQ